MGDAPRKDGGLELDLDLLISSSPACSTHKQLIPGHPALAAYLAGAVPSGGRDVGTVPHLAGQASLQKYLLKKSAAPPRGKPGPGAEPQPGLQAAEQGNECECLQGAGHCPAPPGSAQGTGQGVRLRGTRWWEQPSTAGQGALCAPGGSHGLLEEPRAGRAAAPVPSSLSSLPGRLPLLPA